MLIIGICGASGSGKSTLAKGLAENISRRCVYLQQDCYYRDHSDMCFEDRVHINYDEPEAFEHDVLRNDLALLREGKPITAKNYDYTQHRRADTNAVIEPADIVILEGIHIFYDEHVRDLMDIKIFMRVDPDICLARRIRRDINERGRDIDGIYNQYLNTVKPMYEKYIRYYINYADIILGNSKNPRTLEMLIGYIQNTAH